MNWPLGKKNRNKETSADKVADDKPFVARMKRVGKAILAYRPFKRLDRYIIVKFLGTYIFSITLIISIAVIFDINERIDKITQSHAPFKQIVFDYYLNFIPYFSNLFSPLFVFISVIMFTTNLTGHSEIIAMKSTGMSFRRLLRPYMITATIIALTTFLLGAFVIPKGNISRVNFENKYFKHKNVTSVDNVQLQVSPGVIAFISHFDNDSKSGYGFSLDKFVNKKLVAHLTAQTISYDTLSSGKYHWKLNMYSIRVLKGMRENITNGEKLDTLVAMEPADFVNTINQQETMTVTQLSEYIAKQKQRGAANVNVFEVEYHKRFAMPFAAFILTLIGVSLSCEKQKGGMGLSLSIGIALSFLYILFQTISSTFALNAGWPPMISVWIPNILFIFIALYLYHKTPE